MSSAPTREFTLERMQVIARPPADVFAFFSDPTNLEAITPAWLRFRILEAPEWLTRGSLLRYGLRLFGIPFSWRTEIVEWRPPRTFTDIQLSGPYPLWEHAHRFTPVAGGTEVFDHVRYRVPGSPLASLVQRAFVGRWLDEIFDYRAKRLAALLESGDAHASLRGGTSVSNEASGA
jgi:ligand-binding SRPBCC domain-containing protein